MFVLTYPQIVRTVLAVAGPRRPGVMIFEVGRSFASQTPQRGDWSAEKKGSYGSPTWTNRAAMSVGILSVIRLPQAVALARSPPPFFPPETIAA